MFCVGWVKRSRNPTNVYKYLNNVGFILRISSEDRPSTQPTLTRVWSEKIRGE
ncbi:hypothetical protein [Okeania sp. SIO1I7]|uniref:hypothetical protein n=1 Tax=Okeania sp. SIO1I7 TaxID=2607772 RepID=UPI0013F7BEAF|nr:hypothetical protein [Okeania sp. SIO1I7]NET25745.1 hypothetical protein [Okeania sp. SIO1I7]